MNEVQWEYLLLHNLSKEWIPMTGENNAETKQEELETSKGVSSERPDEEGKTEGNKEGEEVSGTTPTGHKATNSQPNTNGDQTHTHSSGQGTEAQSGGRESSGTSGNTPGDPTSLPTGDFGKDRDGSWKTRTTERKSFSFQKRKREREAAKGQKG